jgi:hypothetical protein
MFTNLNNLEDYKKIHTYFLQILDSDQNANKELIVDQLINFVAYGAIFSVPDLTFKQIFLSLENIEFRSEILKYTHNYIINHLHDCVLMHPNYVEDFYKIVTEIYTSEQMQNLTTNLI